MDNCGLSVFPTSRCSIITNKFQLSKSICFTLWVCPPKYDNAPFLHCKLWAAVETRVVITHSSLFHDKLIRLMFTWVTSGGHVSDYLVQVNLLKLVYNPCCTCLFHSELGWTCCFFLLNKQVLDCLCQLHTYKYGNRFGSAFSLAHYWSALIHYL